MDRYGNGKDGDVCLEVDFFVHMEYTHISVTHTTWSSISCDPVKAEKD